MATTAALTAFPGFGQIRAIVRVMIATDCIERVLYGSRTTLMPSIVENRATCATMWVTFRTRLCASGPGIELRNFAILWTAEGFALLHFVIMRAHLTAAVFTVQHGLHDGPRPCRHTASTAFSAGVPIAPKTNLTIWTTFMCVARAFFT
jgi:hypothetical protein